MCNPAKKKKKNMDGWRFCNIASPFKYLAYLLNFDRLIVQLCSVVQSNYSGS